MASDSVESLMSIVEKCNEVWYAYGSGRGSGSGSESGTETGKLADLISWFDTEGFIVKSTAIGALQCIVIFYKNSVQKWMLWCRQARGVVLHLDTSVGRWVPIKYMFPRGAEVLTRTHLANGIQRTENVTSQNLTMFDESQQTIMHKIMNGEPINGYLSMKVDGMLVVITLYSGKLRDLIRTQESDPLLKVLDELATEHNCPFLPVISTQKTFNVTDLNTTKYIVTSLLLSVLSDDTVEEIKDMFQRDDNTLLPYDLLRKYGANLLKSLNVFYQEVAVAAKPDTEWVSLCLEAVCPNRTCFWGLEHNELAVNYSTGFCKVLSYATDLQTIPHFMFSDLIVKMGLEEPYWWRIDHSETINSMLVDLSRFIMGEIDDYVTIRSPHPPSNRYPVRHPYVDPEGFVFWSEIKVMESKDSSLMDYPHVDYHKIKTREYYEAHNPNNLGALIRIASHTTVFPIASRVHIFYQSLTGRLINVANCFRKIMGLYHADDINLELIFSHILRQDQSPLDYILEGVTNPKALASFNNQQNINTRCKMVLNLSNRSLEVCNIMFMHYFPELCCVGNTENNSRMLKQLLTFISPWSDAEYINNITNMVSTMNQAVEKLYSLLVNEIVNPRTNDSSESSGTVKYIVVKSFVVMGCPKSTDIDIAVEVTSRTDLRGKVDTEMLLSKLAALGYDTTKELDITTVYVEKGNIMETNKGSSDEVQNIVYYTYGYHTQMYPCFVLAPVTLDIVGKIRTAAKFVLDYMKILIGPIEYQIEREGRRQAYQGIWNRVTYVASIFHKISLQENKLHEWLSMMKSLTMKIIQTLLLENNIYEYTKPGLAAKLSELYPEDPTLSSDALWFLMRGYYDNPTVPTTFLTFLMNQFRRLAVEYKPVELKWIDLPLNTAVNPTELPDAVYQEFLKSPITPTSDFVQQFMALCRDQHINKIFPIRCTNIDKITDGLLDHIVDVDQRSDEWKKLLTFYTCGTNSGVPVYDPLTSSVDWVTFYYNLIRGCIVELMIIRNLDFSIMFPHMSNSRELTKITVGLLVEEKDKRGSVGIAPDILLLLDNNEIVPVEIKCLVGKPADNASYRGTIHLATLQLGTSVRIIRQHMICNHGIILMVYLYDGLYHVRASIVDFVL